MEHPITPPPELVQQWRKQAPVVLNFRALCVNLLDCLEKADWPPRYRHVFGQWASVARTALAEPVAEPPAVAKRPSDEELGLIYHDCCRGCEFMDQVGFEDAARAVLARWGQPPAPPAEGEVAELVAALRIEAWAYGQLNTYREWAAKLARTAELLERHAAPVPVPVAERLPGPEDCDAEGYCWRWNTIAGSWARQPISRSWYEFETHWLPAHALPLPAPQGGEVQP